MASQSGIFVNDKKVSFEQFGQDSKIFDEDMSISKYADKIESDGWKAVRDGLVSSLFYKMENGIAKFMRVVSSGDTDINRMFKEDSAAAKKHILDNGVKTDHFEYLPVVFVLKNGKTTKKGGVRNVVIDDSAEHHHGIVTSNISLVDGEEANKALHDNTCPVCFMEKANGHCMCDFG